MKPANGMRRRASANGVPADDPLLTGLEAAVTHVFGHLRRSVQRNQAVVAVAFVRLLSGARSGQGRLSLSALARVCPTAGTPHAREKRLGRFLNNPRLDARGVTSGLARVVFGARGAGCWPMLLDQTHSGATQALVAGVPFEGRTLPLGVYTFDYPWQEAAAGSHNQVERHELAHDPGRHHEPSIAVVRLVHQRVEPALVALSAGRLLLRELDRLAASRTDFAFESTLSGRSYAVRLRRWREAGYRIEFVFLRLTSPQLPCSASRRA